MASRVSVVPSQQNAGGFGSITWANEPPSEAEREQVRAERALMRAIISDNKSEFETVFAKHSQIINVNFESSGKTTPLHAAMAFGRTEMVQFLLLKRANVHAKNSLGFTPLVSAVVNGHEACVRLALEAGASKSEKTARGATPLEIAHKKGFSGIVSILS